MNETAVVVDSARKEKKSGAIYCVLARQCSADSNKKLMDCCFSLKMLTDSLLLCSEIQKSSKQSTTRQFNSSSYCFVSKPEQQLSTSVVVVIIVALWARSPWQSGEKVLQLDARWIRCQKFTNISDDSFMWKFLRVIEYVNENFNYSR